MGVGELVDSVNVKVAVSVKVKLFSRETVSMIVFGVRVTVLVVVSGSGQGSVVSIVLVMKFDIFSGPSHEHIAMLTIVDVEISLLCVREIRRHQLRRCIAIMFTFV